MTGNVGPLYQYFPLICILNGKTKKKLRILVISEITIEFGFGLYG